MDAVAQDFFMLRRPLLPLEALYQFNEMAESAPENFEEQLISVFNQPLYLEALFTVSPSLYDAFLTLRDGGMKDRKKILVTLYKYFVRMCTRATPYGLFAGIAVGKLSSHTCIQFSDESALKKHTRLDMALLAKISSSFKKNKGLQSRLQFFPNTTLYFLDGCYRYIERVQLNEDHQFVIAAIQTNAAMEKVLKSCKNGGKIPQMVESLRGEMSKKQANDFIEALINEQVLYSELEISVTGPLYQDLLIKKLCGLRMSKQAAHLKKITKLITPQAGLTQLLQARGTISRLPIATPTMIQTDLQFQTESCRLGRSCINILAKEFEKVMNVLYAREVDREIKAFKDDFFRKYQNQEIPLLIALDSESGVGFGASKPGNSDYLPLLDELPLGSLDKSPDGVDELASFKEEILERAITGGTTIVELLDADFLRFEKIAPPEAEGFYWLGSLISDSQSAIDQGNFKFILKGLGGPSGFELIGRFSHIDQRISENLASWASTQDSDDCVFAEITHVPEPKIANVLQRSHIRKYEIVLLCGSSLPREDQLPPSDLMISVPNGKEIVVRSKRLNKRIIPRMSTAHNFSQGLPLYRFLCKLSAQDNHFLYNWSWGPVSARVFLPRIQYKHWIIARASWRITKGNYPSIFEAKNNFDQEWNNLQKNLSIPRYIQVYHGDNELLIDCDNRISRCLLKSILNKQLQVTLTEFLDKPGQGFIQQQGRFFTNELVIPFQLDSSLTTRGLPTNLSSNQSAIQRDFTVGSAWLYTKIYAGTKSTDQLLIKLIKPFCRALMLENKIEKWFFIRYQDPLPHIRLRFYNGNDFSFWQIVLGSLSNLLRGKVESGLISKFQTDIYHREIERYQGLDFEQTESIFHADSLAVIDILEIIGEDNEQLRWQAGLVGASQLIEDLGFRDIRKLELIQVVHGQLLTELSSNKLLTKQLDKKYRAFKNIIWQTLAGGDHENLYSINKILSLRSERIACILKNINPPFHLDNSTAASFIHIFLNRLFTSRGREQELVIYHYLYKHYKSTMKRQNFA
nr:lantibiotic dehydratase [uncultured Dyadobacter sp.]